MRYTGHILELENALSESQCADAIEWYKLKQADAKWHYACEGKDDTYICASHYGSYMKLLGRHINSQLRSVYEEYAELTGFPKTISKSFQHKFQKHVPGGGFQKWHCEHNHKNADNKNRCAVWMYYLNEQQNAGTEFLYPRLTVPAQTGKLVIFPAYSTHVHSTQTGYTKDKYIVTGWFYVRNKQP